MKKTKKTKKTKKILGLTHVDGRGLAIADETGRVLLLLDYAGTLHVHGVVASNQDLGRIEVPRG